MNEEFEILAAKVLADEASANEAARLRELLAANPQLQEEFKRLEEASEYLHEARGLAVALDSAPQPVPASRLSELEDYRRQKFGSAPSSLTDDSTSAEQRRSPGSSWWREPFKWLAYGTGLAVLVVSLVLLAQNKTKQRSAEIIAYIILEHGVAEFKSGTGLTPAGPINSLRRGDEVILAANSRATAVTHDGVLSLAGPRRITSEELRQSSVATTPEPITQWQKSLHTALFGSRTNLLDSGLLVATRAAPGIRLYSPLGATASLTPVFIWKAEAVKTYNVIIADAFDDKTPAWQASGVVPPLAFTNVSAWQGRPLAPNNLYRIKISATDELITTSSYTFRTIGDAPQETPNNDTAKLLDALQLLSNGSGRIGDAFADLLTLSEPLAGSEFVGRLKLLAFAEAGYREDFEALALKISAGK